MHYSLGTLGYGDIWSWLYEQSGAKESVVEPQIEEIERRVTTVARRELETGGAALKRELEEGGAQLRREMTAGEAQLKRTAMDAVVMSGAAVIGLWLYLRK